MSIYENLQDIHLGSPGSGGYYASLKTGPIAGIAKQYDARQCETAAKYDNYNTLYDDFDESIAYIIYERPVSLFGCF